MLAFPKMLMKPAQEAGIKVPENAESYNAEEFPHFFVYLQSQLGRSLPYPSAHWDNAKIVASIPNNEIKKVTLCQLCEKGFA